MGQHIQCLVPIVKEQTSSPQVISQYSVKSFCSNLSACLGKGIPKGHRSCSLCPVPLDLLLVVLGITGRTPRFKLLEHVGHQALELMNFFTPFLSLLIVRTEAACTWCGACMSVCWRLQFSAVCTHEAAGHLACAHECTQTYRYTCIQFCCESWDATAGLAQLLFPNFFLYLGNPHKMSSSPIG